MHGIGNSVWIDFIFTVLIMLSEPLSAGLVVIGFIATVISLVIYFIMRDDREDAKIND